MRAAKSASDPYCATAKASSCSATRAGNPRQPATATPKDGDQETARLVSRRGGAYAHDVCFGYPPRLVVYTSVAKPIASTTEPGRTPLRARE